MLPRMQMTRSGIVHHEIVEIVLLILNQLMVENIQITGTIAMIILRIFKKMFFMVIALVRKSS